MAQRIRQVRHLLAPGELRVAEALAAAYPTAGLVPIAQLAAEAEVSAPTALRLVGKLGFSGYGAFQEALREEVQTRLFSPVTIYPEGEGEPVADTSELVLAADRYAEGLRTTVRGLPTEELADAVRQLADPNRSVTLVGGRFTWVLAAQLAQYLRLMRPGVTEVPPTSAAHMTSLVDVDPTTVAVIFDSRRYQQSTIDWGIEAVHRGASLILVTDMYLSPLASYADAVLATSHAGAGPFDSMAHGFVLVELLVSFVAREIGTPARDRLAAFEQLQLAEEQVRPRSRRP